MCFKGPQGEEIILYTQLSCVFQIAFRGLQTIVILSTTELAKRFVLGSDTRRFFKALSRESSGGL